MGPMVKGKSFQKKEPPMPDTRGSALGKPPAVQVSKVDWQSEKLTPDQWRFLSRLYGQFAELLAPHLTQALQCRAIVELEGIAQEPFREFLEPFYPPTPTVVFSLDEKNKALIAFDPSTAFALFDYLLGGKGEPLDILREFTEIEISLFQKYILSKFLLAHTDSWQPIMALASKMDRLEFAPDNVVLFPYAETVLSVSFTLQFGATTGSFQLALPFKFIRNVLPRNPDEVVEQKASRHDSPFVEKKIEMADMPIAVELGKAKVPFQELLGLEEGDIVRLETTHEDRLKIKVAGKIKFLGKPGASENKIAVQITNVVEEGDDEIDE